MQHPLSTEILKQLAIEMDKPITEDTVLNTGDNIILLVDVVKLLGHKKTIFLTSMLPVGSPIKDNYGSDDSIGWVTKTQSEIEKDIGFSPKTQTKYTKELSNMGFLLTKHTNTCGGNHYKVNLKAIDEYVEANK